MSCAHGPAFPNLLPEANREAARAVDAVVSERGRKDYGGPRRGSRWSHVHTF
jgi:hypothetical protein